MRDGDDLDYVARLCQPYNLHHVSLFYTQFATLHNSQPTNTNNYGFIIVTVDR